MVALAERLRLELDSSDRKNLVGSQIIPDKSALIRWIRSGKPSSRKSLVNTGPLAIANLG
jgi:hypothetical protein